MQELAGVAYRGTFRDPAGSVEVRPDGAFRCVHATHAADMLAFLEHPLASRLVSEGRLIASELRSRDAETGPLLLRHPRVSFPSYSWEWSPALWLAAAELTLGICADLLREGWVLKDATPLNILFQGVRPVLVDVLSIQRADPEQPIWLAYGQFVRTFLLPMLAHSKLGWPLQSSLMRRDGYEPEDIYSALTWPGRLQRPALTCVTLPVLLSGKSGGSADRIVLRKARDVEIARQVLLKTLSSLGAHMRRVTPAQRSSTWSDYAETATHYSEDDHDGKRGFVRAALTASRPRRVLDVGCNTGVYSALAADAGAEVIAIDTDIQAVDRLCRKLAGSGRDILPLCVDLAHPTPATGWQNCETLSFLDRAKGHFDMVMMLAVVHHLLLRNQVPLDRIASFCGDVTTRNLIIEWVPPNDVKFRELLRGRGEIYAHITESAFRSAFAEYFDTVREMTLANGRILFHFQKKYL